MEVYIDDMLVKSEKAKDHFLPLFSLFCFLFLFKLFVFGTLISHRSKEKIKKNN